MFSGSRIAGGGRGRGGLSRPSLVWHPDRRSTPDPDGWLNGLPPLRGGLRTRIEMTGTNYISGAPRFGERQRQLLKKRKAARGHSFPRLTSHANGRLPSGTPPAFSARKRKGDAPLLTRPRNAADISPPPAGPWANRRRCGAVGRWRDEAIPIVPRGARHSGSRDARSGQV